MILGTVTTAGHEATIELAVRGPGGTERKTTAVIDTGFSGSLTLPPGFVSDLGLPWHGRHRAVLADGGIVVLDVYEGTVIWDGRHRRILISAASGVPLVGMRLLHGYKLTVEVVGGGVVRISALGPSGA